MRVDNSSIFCYLFFLLQKVATLYILVTSVTFSLISSVLTFFTTEPELEFFDSNFSIRIFRFELGSIHGAKVTSRVFKKKSSKRSKNETSSKSEHFVNKRKITEYKPFFSKIFRNSIKTKVRMAKYQKFLGASPATTFKISRFRVHSSTAQFETY